MKNRFEFLIDGLVSLTVPLILSTLSVLLLLSPLFVNFEYIRPGFPPDRYGFTTQERLEYGNLTRKYLVTSSDLDVLRSLQFDSGEPLYQERELSHLRDVKVVLSGVWQAWGASLLILVLAGFYNRSQRRLESYLKAIFRGGRLTAVLLIAILILTVSSFQALFTDFHRIFFEGDSWLFSYSDTLIRLFPLQFWQDAFILFGALTLLGGVILGWILPAWRRKAARIQS